VVQALIASSSERRRREEESGLRIRDERREVYAHFLSSTPLSEILPIVISEGVQALYRAEQDSSHPLTREESVRVMKRSVAYAWQTKAMPAYSQYIHQSMAASLVASPRVLDAISQEGDVVGDFFTRGNSEEIVEEFLHTDEGKGGQLQLNTMADRFSEARQAVTNAMKEELGYPGQ
jgi:hypothetical protein